MENDFKSQSKKKKRNRNKKRNPQKIQDENMSKTKCSEIAPTKILSSSPRPSDLPTKKNNKKVDYKRNSGSEYDDFQTPSVEYDIKNEEFDETKCEDISHDYDKEWEEVGSFKSANLENILEQEQNHHSEITATSFMDTNDDCNGGSMIIELSNDKRTFVDNCKNEIIVGRDKCDDVLVENNEEMLEEVNVNDLVDDNDENVNCENYTMCVNQFFEDIDDDSCAYPLKDMVDESQCNDIVTDVTHTIEDTGVTAEILMTQEVEEEKTIIDNEPIDLICTQDNLKEETLAFQRIFLNVSHELVIQKSWTLRPKASETSYKQSATSITNVTSISDDNIPLTVDNDFKSIKKSKTNTFNIYKSFIKKFKKAKTPEKEQLKKEPSEHNLSLRSHDVVKDSEIESNQSLKSINDIDSNSQIFPQRDNNETNVLDITEEKPAIATADVSISDRKPSDTNLESKPETMKIEKSKRFTNILKKKHKTKKDPEVKINDDSIPQNTEIVVIQQNAEIEKEVIAKFDEAIESLMCGDPETIFDECVTGNNGHKTHMDVSRDHFPNNDYDEDGDDHLFPDAITATKILGIKPVDVPYIDDPVVSKLDYITFYNGESKRIRISPEFYVPRASMETLFSPGESISKRDFQKPLISHSPSRRKRVLGNILGYMTKGR